MRNISTVQRIMLPLVMLILIGVAILVERETSQQMQGIEEAAKTQASAIVRLLNVTQSLVGNQVHGAIHLLIQRSLIEGFPRIEGETSLGEKRIPNLYFGNIQQTNRTDLVDSVTTVLGGTATLFVKSDQNFIRVATNILDSQNHRAIGTLLNPKGKAIASIRNGNAYYGVVDILGEPYITGYEPIKDQAGNTIGVWYVGYKVEMQALQQAIEKLHFLKNGFSAVLDYNSHIRFLSSHTQINTAQSILNHPPQDWKVVSQDLPEWGFQVMLAYPKSEAILEGLSKITFVILTGGVIALVLVIVAFAQLRNLVLKPIGGDPATAIELAKEISNGELEGEKIQAPHDSLIAHMVSMRSKIRELVTSLQQSSENLSLAASVFRHAHDSIYIADPDFRLIDINPAFTRLTGFERDEAIGKKLKHLNHMVMNQQLLAENGEWHGEAWLKKKNNEDYAASIDIFAVQQINGKISHYIGIFSDITQLKESQKSLEHLAYHDPLTGLPNRTLFSDRLNQGLARTDRSGDMMAVCFFDLDGFKPINDNYGHETGDLLLKEFANRISMCLRSDDTVARLGGDEFALLLCGIETREEAEQTLERLLQVIRSPFHLADKIVQISSSIGYTIYPDDKVDPDILLRHSDHAMYQAKLAGGDRFMGFTNIDT